MPTNLYGPGDNFDLKHSHVLPALMRKAHEAKLRGGRRPSRSGAPARRGASSSTSTTAADAMVFLMKNYSDEGIVNVGPGSDVPIVELVDLICEVVGYKGGVQFDASRPDGMPRKMVDTTFAASLGWRARTPLREGLAATYRWYVDNIVPERQRAVA